MRVPRQDSASRAFIEYARMGLDRRKMTSIEAAARIRGAMGSEARALRLLAVHDTLRVLEAQGNGESADAVRAIYFSGRGRVPRKNDISYAVRRFAHAYHMDERTAWRRLETAKRLYNSLLGGQMKCL